MDRLKRIFEIYKEPIIAIRDEEILWCNSAADSFLGDEDEREKLKRQVLAAISSCDSEDFAMTADINGVRADIVVSQIDDMYIVGISAPDNEDTKEVEAMLGAIEGNAKGAMALFNMSSGMLRPHIEGMNDAKLSTYAAIQSHSYYSLAYIIDSVSKLNMSDKTLKESDKNYFDIVLTCNNIVHELGIILKYKEIDIRVESDERSIKFFGNEAMIYMALMKLISNSMKYVEKNGEIVLSVRTNGKYLAVSVSDNGSGIAKEKMLGIFSRYKERDTLRDSKEGIGIGLYVVKQVASMHGGTVILESREDEGTKVTMMLPFTHRSNILLREPEQPYRASIHEILAEFADALDYRSYMP